MINISFWINEIEKAIFILKDSLLQNNYLINTTLGQACEFGIGTLDLSYGPMTYGLGMTHTACLKVVGAGAWLAHKILVIPSQNLDFPTLRLI